MSKPVLETQEVAAQIEEAANKYADIKKNTDNEIAKIKQQLLDIGVPGSTIVKLKPVWQPDAYYLLRKEAGNTGEEFSKKAG